MTNSSTPTLTDRDMSWYDATKTYCLIEVESRPADVLERPENERFVSLIPPIADHEEKIEELPRVGLALTFCIDTFIDVAEGHGFGRDPDQCDILLEEDHGVDELHFRLQLDYTQKRPELDIINCSRLGTSVDDRALSDVGQKARIYQGEIVQITAGNVSFRLLFPYLDFTNRKMVSRWDELRMTAWSLLEPSVRNLLIPRGVRQRYLDAEEECIWRDTRPLRYETADMTVCLAKGRLRQKTAFPVVLKKLRDARGGTREERISMGETEAMSRVRHENLVGAFREAWPQGNVILVQYTPHGSIADFVRLHNGARLKEDAVMDLASQVLNALAHLATQGLAHRDVKPSKIMVFRTDPPLFKLSDFGGEDHSDVRAYLADRIADATIDYVAPEVFERGAQAPASKTEVWSLGIVMWELLVGTTPVSFIEEMGFVTCFRAILNWQPRARELQRFGVSDEGQELLLRMVERNPKFRPDVEMLRVDECFDYLEQVRRNEPCDLQDCIL